MNNFDKNWKNAKNCIFRLETRPEYHVAGDWENFEKWKQGTLDQTRDKFWKKWTETLEKTKAKGIAVQRVRVAPNPLPSYIKFEIELWQKDSAKTGEELFFISTGEYQGIIAESGFDTKDFWLFDDQNLLIFNYDKAGKFTGDIAIASGGMINRYCDLKKKLLQKSRPLESFVKNEKSS